MPIATTTMPKVKTDAGVGLSAKEFPSHIKADEPSQTSRALAIGSYFLSGCMAINASQFLGAPLSLINQDWYNAWIAFTKQSWGLLMMTMTQCWAPTIMRVSGHESVRGQLHRTVNGNLLCTFPERLVLIANHQIYTDWLYLWWMGYTAGMHGHVYIVLKESLKKIPLLGWGMQFSQFIFLKRKWEMDKACLANHLQNLNNASNPMWLILFPEGTNLAPCTRERSRRWAVKHNIDDLQHQLLPRSTGLLFCLQELRKTVDFVYDCTIAYEGIPRGQYAQDIFTLGASYLGGNPPKSVNMYWRRFPVSSIPLDDPHAFEYWLRARWTEKDRLIESYLRTGRFPADVGVSKGRDGKIRRGAGYIETEIKPTHWYDFLQVFAPIGLFALVLYVFYGALPKRILESFDRRVVVNKSNKNEQVKLPGNPETFDAVLRAFGNEIHGLKSARTAKKLVMDGGTLQQALQGINVPGKVQVKGSLSQNLVMKNRMARDGLAKGPTIQKSLTDVNTAGRPHRLPVVEPQRKKQESSTARNPMLRPETNPPPKKLVTKPSLSSNPRRAALNSPDGVSPAMMKHSSPYNGAGLGFAPLKPAAAKSETAPVRKRPKGTTS